MNTPTTEESGSLGFWQKGEEELFRSLITLPLKSCKSLATGTVTVAALYGVWVGFFFRNGVAGHKHEALVALVPFIAFALATYRLGRGFLPVMKLMEGFPLNAGATSKERVLTHETHIRRHLTQGIVLLWIGVGLAFSAVIWLICRAN